MIRLLRKVFAPLLFASFLACLAYGCGHPRARLFGRVAFRLTSRARVVALTFDDGPNGASTQQVLDILSRERVAATFFIVGKNAEFYPTLAREIARRGHTIGNHSHGHAWRLPFQSRQAIAEEVQRAAQAIFAATGVYPALFRPPHGLRSPAMMQVLRAGGYGVVTWDVMTRDYSRRMSVEVIVSRILKSVRPGSIICLHDGLNTQHGVDRSNTVQALPRIIRGLRKKGYAFVPLDGCPSWTGCHQQ